jgi:hypothetical protein
MCNIDIKLCLPKALTLTHVQSYEVIQVLRIIRINKRLGCCEILHSPLLRDECAYRLRRAIPLQEEGL